MAITDQKVEQKLGSAFEAPPVAKKRRRDRKDRVPFGSTIPKMGLSKEDQQYFESRGEVVRWFNDDPGRLDRAVENDYRFVDSREMAAGPVSGVAAGVGSRRSMVVGTNEDGSPKMAYLMAKPREFYEEDQMEKMGKVAEKENAMLQGIDKGGFPGDKEGRYIPSAGISLKRE